MKDLFILKVLDKASKVISNDQIMVLRTILEEELYECELQKATTDIVPVNVISEKVFLFLASKKLDGRSRKTLESYSRCLNRFSRFIQKDINDLSAMDIRMFLATYSKAGAKNTTLATNISILKSFFGWLQGEELITRNPMLKIPTTKVEKRIRKSLTLEELEMLRVACETERDHAMVEFFYSTGCRLEEAINVNKQDINWSDGSLHVIGKGDKERIVYLNAKAKVHLWRYLNTRKDNNEALFVGRKEPHERLGARAVEKIFNKLGKVAGITKDVFPHLIRHTTATNMLNSGASLMEVQEYLGHDSPATTQIYAQIDKESVRYSHKKHVV